MSWTLPKTWSAVVVTVADLNTHIRDNLNILKTSINDDGTLHGCSRLYDTSTSAMVVQSTTTETTVYTKSVAGGLLGTNGALRLTISGVFFNGTGSARDLWIKASFGGTVVAGANNGGTAFGTNYSSVANERAFRMVLELKNVNSASLQYVVTSAVMGEQSSPTTDWASVIQHAQVMKTSLAINTASAQTLAVTVQLSASSVGLYFIVDSAVLELITA